MKTRDMRIEFGTLHDVLGKPATQDRLSIVPALVELHGGSSSTGFELRDAVGNDPPAVLALPIEQHYDAAWVRARLPRVFAFAPEIAEVEKSLLDVGFVAVAFGSSLGFPFVCTDYYGQTGLTFSTEGPDEGARAKIASAFWSLLLQSPDDLEDFEAAVYHPGAGVWMHFGCADGEPYYRESRDERG